MFKKTFEQIKGENGESDDVGAFIVREFIFYK
jgi:hypothetical protein